MRFAVVGRWGIESYWRGVLERTFKFRGGLRSAIGVFDGLSFPISATRHFGNALPGISALHGHGVRRLNCRVGIWREFWAGFGQAVWPFGMRLGIAGPVFCLKGCDDLRPVNAARSGAISRRPVPNLAGIAEDGECGTAT